ncbi:hypothetical protein [Mycobacterium sp. DL592]|uniref:hypothetical protein n=1 Tax=Mycobacterium sp. DL592 TaxID=2675524 RepID=UPI001423DCE4|nr:hypothetical protein [Mycobacterium sp. DL592]
MTSTTSTADYIKFLEIFGFRGSDTRVGGISTQGDVLVNSSADGVDLNTIWATIQAALDIWNKERSNVASLLSYTTTNVADAIPQSLSSESFEEASEFGVPHSVREPATALPLGYTLKDFDLAMRYSWKFLRDSTSEQIKSVFNRTLEADNKLVNGSVLRRIFTPTEELNEHGHRCFGLWTGSDGITPPPYLGKTFASSTSHYLTSGATQIDSLDIELAIGLITDKGYGRSPSSQLLILANPYDGEFITTWKAGVESRSGGPIAKWDFVRSSTAPAYLTDQTIVGKIPPGDYNGLPVQGSYGPAWLITTQYIPQGYVAVVASSGQNAQDNPVAIRVHPNTKYQGLRLIPGNGPYPIQESFAARGFGVGVRHRGAAVCIQVTTSGSYTAPTFAL